MAAGTGFQHILLEKRAGVAHLVLNRPDKLNALGAGPGSSRDEILLALADADADEEIGCILIRAVGRAFSAGGDLSRIEKRQAEVETPFESFLFYDRAVGFYAALAAVNKPIVAAVNGLCLGAALGLVARCDLVIAGDDARFGLIEGRIGHPGAAELVPLIGPAWTKFMILTGELLDAHRAAEIGLALCVEASDRLLERATALAERIALMPREATVLNKAGVDAIADAAGRASGRVAGQAHETLTRSMTHAARAPDGRRFEDILRQEGMAGLKRARDTQYSEPWLRPGKPADKPA